MINFDEILQKFKSRNTKEEKRKFQEYVLALAKENGKTARVERCDNHENIIIGDEKNAKVIYTAHYDTPKTALFPNLMLPTAKGLHLLYAIAVILPLLAIGFLAFFLFFAITGLDTFDIKNRLLGLIVYLAFYFGAFYLFFKCKKNKNNFNDNTSGVLTVLNIAFRVNKSNVAFILFDDEEKGKLGSKAFAKSNEKIKKNIPVYNFDCVGNGDCFIFISSKQFTFNGLYGDFYDTYSSIDKSLFYSDEKAKANSDQTNFDLGVAILACKKSKHGIYYTNKIHTEKDTVISLDNISTLVEKSVKYIDSHL